MPPSPSGKTRRARRPKKSGSSNRTDAAERWQLIAKAATDLFKRKGFASTTMQDVSDAVGLLKGSLYYYIESKEDLLFKILQGLHKDGDTIIASVNFNSEDPLEQLHLYIWRASMYAANNADRLAIFLRDFHNVPKSKQREIISEREMYANTVLTLVEEAKEKGLTRPDLDVALAAKLISSAISSTHEWFRPNGRRPIEEAGYEIAELLTNTIRNSTKSPDNRVLAPKSRLRRRTENAA
jgi:AcrR family transcriptional regulator